MVYQPAYLSRACALNKNLAVADMPPERLYERIRQMLAVHVTMKITLTYPNI